MLHVAAIVILALVLWGLIANYRIESKAKGKEILHNRIVQHPGRPREKGDLRRTG